MDVRKATSKLLEMIEEGLLNPKDVVIMCLKWMNEDDVIGMLIANEIDLDEDSED